MGARYRSIHHFLHPKKLYKGKGNNYKRLILSETHREYHGFFDHFCRTLPRMCQGCRFGWMCCYYNSEVQYGRRLT